MPLGAALVGLALAGAASADTRWERHHPRQDQVLDRTHRQERRITEERREGDLTAAQAHRLRAADHRIAAEDHAYARANGGYITPAEQGRMNRQENRVSSHIPQ
ncbi:MAG: hypothetical protein JSR86_14145 [Proteobacteria bacterium]|nr:hypothetical protein [Pseudomonadota bacterium]